MQSYKVSTSREEEKQDEKDQQRVVVDDANESKLQILSLKAMTLREQFAFCKIVLQRFLKANKDFFLSINEK